MSLRTRVFLIVAPSVVLVTLLVFFVLSYQMMAGYEQIETRDMSSHVSSAVATFRRQAITELCRGDWSYWDDVYEFVDNLNEEFVDTNISPQSFADVRIDTMIFVDASSQVVFTRSYDPATSAEQPVAPDLVDALKPGSVFLQHAEPYPESYVWGLIPVGESVYSVGSRPILTSGYEGPVRGSLIMARRVTDDQIKELGDQLRLECKVYSPAAGLPPDIAPIVEQTAVSTEDESGAIVSRKSEDRIAGYAVLKDIAGNAALVLEIETPRHIYLQAKTARQGFALSFIAIGVFMLAGLIVVLELIIVSRLRALGTRVREIRTGGDWSARIAVKGHDELSGLAKDVNTLIAALSESIRKEDEKDRRFRMLTTHASVGMYESAPGGLCSFVNRRWCEIAGMSLEQALGDGWHNAVHPEDRGWVRTMGAERVAQGEPFDFECRFQRPDGVVRNVMVNVVPMHDHSGQLTSCIGSVMDISDIRRAEAELRDNERRYRGIIEMQVELVCRYRPDTTLTYVNDAYCLYFGRSREDLLGKSFREVLPSDEPLDATLLELRNASGPVTSRHKSVSDLGEERWQEWVDTPVRDADGHIVEFQAVGRDITERKAAEDALRESEAKLRSITSAVAEAIIMMDEDGLTTFWNEAAERTFGYSRMEMLGRPLHEVIVPERYRAAFRTGHSHFRETGLGAVVGRMIEIQGLRKDGSEFPIELTIAAVRFSGTWHAIGTARDITERKRVEEQLEQNARTLEAANAQLESAIAQANQLALEAQVASVAKSDFVANMSHEIRTPLNGVIGMTTLLLDTDLTQEQRDFAETVRTSGEALLSVVNDILDFSKIEAGKMELESIPFDLRAAVEQIGDMLAPRAQEKGLQFTILIHHDVPEYVKGDPGRVRQILLNLAGNAMKFTERGEIVVSAQLHTSGGAEAVVLFEVTDSGIGIPQERVKALFQPFTQADTSTTRKYGGTGLGLTISKRLCEAMGGEIGVRSTPGQGSTFHFTARFEVASPPEAAAPADLSSLAGMRLLVVDGSVSGRQVYRELLRDWGVSVSEVADADAAYDAMRSATGHATPYGVVLVDHHQPKLGAAEFAEKVKGDPVLSRTRLLLVTSWPKRGDAAQMSRHGYEAYLTKPVKRAHLLEAIAAVAARGATGPGSQGELVTQHTLNEAARSRVRILLVEDNVTNQKVASRIIEKLGYRCEIANNGREALEAARKTEYNLILMDCQMPEMDGYEATAALRALQLNGAPRIPIIAMTANSMSSDRERCLDAGMDDYIAKPINFDALRATLARHLPVESQADASS